jgi:26S proteasome subunit RPN2, N-terminal domain
MAPITSVAGYLALLEEPEPELQTQALVSLNVLVDQFWMEIADAGAAMYAPGYFVLSSSEVLYEDEEFPRRELAALVLSKVLLRLRGVIAGVLPFRGVSGCVIVCAWCGQIIRFICEERIRRDDYLYACR